MNRLSWVTRLYWTHFGKPTTERELFKQLIEHPVSSILEVNVGTGARMERIAKLVQLTPGTEKLRYVGIDEFEAASDKHKHLTLKTAHQLASGLGFRASLIPGELKTAVPRVAHKFGTSDLIIIDGGLDPQNPENSIIAGWLRHLAHENSIILATAEIGGALKLMKLPSAQALTAAA